MWTQIGRFALGAVCGTLLFASCNNDNFSNRGVVSAGARFQLVAEGKDTPEHLLFDSATGDLWQLATEPASGSRWVRLTSGPTDVKALTPQQALGGR
jgi:hypothetical protein